MEKLYQDFYLAFNDKAQADDVCPMGSYDDCALDAGIHTDGLYYRYVRIPAGESLQEQHLIYKTTPPATQTIAWFSIDDNVVV